MINVRRATVEDAAELVRLRGLLFGIPAASNENGWRDASRQILVRRLSAASPTMAGFVVDQPERSLRTGAALAASAVGIIEERLGGPGNPRGLVGYMFNVATDPAHRRHGYARACTAALLAWFAAEGAFVVDLKATSAAEPLYVSQGFVRTADPAMRLALPHD
ncbi:GNAT family N-acetyltransferase [Paractinoplanes lichenicola]|uniref:GNAT family N-acetyltransferase n=1 Tax=Paractinoplanes lichenicola TaxID=2802976 RepID=A0ABS1VTC9_9ACTN|nr:GNAT family N-acetyltransferase [Actinoplanes lichenicola]MBL7257726.1 GNAT family N-acetyltransferase [Actinoplanes lichenicola]